MYRPAQIGGYVALLTTAGALLAGSILAPVAVPGGAVGLQAAVGLVVAVAGIVEHRRHLRPFEAGGFDRSDALDALAVVAGSVVTYALSVDAGLGPVLASALVGLLAGVAVPSVATPAYCGSFVGMASPAAFGSVESVGVAGAVAGLGFVATAESFGGVGGKLGTLALLGCVTTAALFGVDFAQSGAPRWDLAHLFVPVAAAGAVAAAVASVRFGAGAVVGSALVGVVAGVAGPLAAPELGATLATVAFCASFVGMSSPERLGSVGHVAVAGGVSGLVFLAVAPAFVGAGGKLGTVAFVSCLTVLGTNALREVVRERRRR